MKLKTREHYCSYLLILVPLLRIMDLIGKTFNHWTVQSCAGVTKDKKQLWLCKCTCGRTKEVRQYSLESGKSKSCGCRSGKDLTGQIFGNLTAIEPGFRGDGVRVWRCLCKCGDESLVRTQSLVEGHTKSCGCLKERKSKKFKAGIFVNSDKFFLTQEELKFLYFYLKESASFQSEGNFRQMLKWLSGKILD